MATRTYFIHTPYVRLLYYAYVTTMMMMMVVEERRTRERLVYFCMFKEKIYKYVGGLHERAFKATITFISILYIILLSDREQRPFLHGRSLYFAGAIFCWPACLFSVFVFFAVIKCIFYSFLLIKMCANFFFFAFDELIG